MIEILAAANTTYPEFFQGDWIVGGAGLCIAWCIKDGIGFSSSE
jgi:hypothetical protein